MIAWVVTVLLGLVALYLLMRGRRWASFKCSTFVRLGQLCEWRANFEGARRYYQDALRESKDFFGVSDHRNAPIRCRLSKILMYTDQYARASEHLMEAISELRSGGREDSKDFAVCLAQFVMAQSRLCDDPAEQHELEKIAKEAAEKLLPFGKVVSSERASVWTALGSLYSSTGRKEDAIAALEKSLQIYRTDLAMRDPHVLVTLNNLALIYMQSERYEEAEGLLQESLDMVAELCGNPSAMVAQALLKLASCSAKAGKFEDAERRIKDAEQMSENLSGPTSEEYIYCISTFGMILTGQSSQEKQTLGLEKLRKAAELAQSQLPENSPMRMHVIRDYAEVAMHCGDREGAEGILEAELMSRRGQLESPSNGSVSNSSSDTAATETERAPLLRANSVKTATRDQLSMLERLAFIDLEKEQFDKAQAEMLEARNLALERFGDESEEYFRFSNLYARILGQDPSQIPDALEIIHATLQSIEKLDSPDTCKFLDLSIFSLSILSQLYEQRGEAIQQLRTQEQILKRIREREVRRPVIEEGGGHMSLTREENRTEEIANLHVLGLLFQRQGDKDGACSCFQDAKALADTMPEDSPKKAHIQAICTMVLCNFFEEVGRGDAEGCIQLLEECLALFSVTIGKAHEDYAFAVELLARCWRNRGELEKCRILLNEALQVRHQVFVDQGAPVEDVEGDPIPLRPEYASVLMNSAEAALQCKLLDVAEKRFLQARRLFEQLFPMMKDQAPLEAMDESSALVRKTANHPSRIEAINCLVRLSAVYMQRIQTADKVQEAAALKAQALALLSKALQVTSIMVKVDESLELKSDLVDTVEELRKKVADLEGTPLSPSP